MSRSTQNTNLTTFIKPENTKLTAAQQKQWASAVTAKMTQSFKAKSVNQVLWGDQKKK